MRWIFAALLLANLGLWMWASWYKAPARPQEAASVPRPDVHAGKLKRLVEPGVRLVPRSSRPEVGALSPAVPNACYRIGPFERPERAAEAGRTLTALGVTFETRPEVYTAVTSWRVYLPPLPSRAAAEAKRKELTQLGFRDHAVLEEPGLEHAISLGVFTVEANAHNHMKRLAARGISAELQTLRRSHTVHWLWLSDALSEERRILLQQRSWGGGAALQQAPCPPSQESQGNSGSLPGSLRYTYNAFFLTVPA